MEWKRINGILAIDNNRIFYCCEGHFSLFTYCYVCEQQVRGEHYKVMLDYAVENIICSECYIKRSLLTI